MGYGRLISRFKHALLDRLRASGEHGSQFDDLTASHFQRYMRTCSSISGWFSRESIALWDCLLSYQRCQEISGHLFEIGVHHGRSAALAAMHTSFEELLVLVDSQSLVCARQNLAAIKPSNVIYLETRSQNLHTYPIVGQLASKCRWIHIDGEHSESAVTSDLECASLLLSANGVISLDDFLSAAYPQIARAVFRYLESPHVDLSLFLCGFNKGYLCRPNAKPSYLTYLKDTGYIDMAARGCRSITFFKTNAPEEVNCFGISNREQDLDYRGLDGDKSTILI
jgi:hypothetical protein